MRKRNLSPIFALSVALMLLSLFLFFATDFLMVIRVLTVVSIGLALLVFLKKEVSLLGIGMLVILDPFTRVFLATGENIFFRWNTNNYILLFCALALWMFHGVKVKDTSSKWLFLLIIVCTLQLAYSTNLIRGTSFILNLLSYFGFLTIFKFILSRRMQILEESYLIIAAIGVMVNAMYWSVANQLPYIDHSSLAQSGLSVLYTLCLGLSFDSNKTRRKVFLTVIFSSITFVIVFISGSRSAGILAFIALLYIFLKSGGYSLFGQFFYGLVGFVFILIVSQQYAGLVDETQIRFSKLLDENLSMAQRTSGRSDLFLVGWYIFLDNPLGIGTGNLDTGIILTYTDNPALALHGVNSVHSALAKVLAENGFLGGLFLISFCASFLYYYFKKDGHEKTPFDIGLLCSLVLFISLFYTEFQGKSLLYLASGASFLLFTNEKEITNPETAKIISENKHLVNNSFRYVKDDK